MVAKRRSEKYIKFAVYLVIVVLVNLAASTLFFRWDLTKNGVYSLSDVSKESVANLTEPLTIKVFFTKDLPAPYNGIERSLRDLLEEYAVSSNRFFNYQFYYVSSDSEGKSSASTENQKLASSYGIQPLQIQQLENDSIEIKLMYMGMVVLAGNVVERIPAITSTDGLEYTLTTTFQRASKKISTLAGLNENIQVKLILSSSLTAEQEGLQQLPDIVKTAVEDLQQKNYNHLDFSVLDPATEAEKKAVMEAYNVVSLEKGVIGLVMSLGDRTVSLPLVEMYYDLFRGAQYQLAKTEDIEEMINAHVEALLGINDNIGYLADHGTLALTDANAVMMGLSAGGDLTTFNDLVETTYSVKQFSLAEDPLPSDVRCLIIARPTEPFSEWELFQIDQALMRGQNLAIFLEPFKEVVSQNTNYLGYQSQQVSFESLDTGLEKLLAHWGVGVEQSIVMDETCLVQTYNQGSSQGKKSFYYAPLIQSENINEGLPMMQNIKELVTLMASPLSLDDKVLKENNLSASVLFSSSKRAWEMVAPIDETRLVYSSPPASDDAFEQKPLACLIEGAFSSYFAGKELPKKPASETEVEEEATLQESDTGNSKDGMSLDSKILNEGGFIEKGQPARIFLIGSGEMLRDNMLDEDGTSTNSMFVMNVIDALNGHDDIALMRSKTQSHNPLDTTRFWFKFKTALKTVNIAGLPLLVVLFGLLIWMRRHVRRKAIQRMFEADQGVVK